MAASWLTTTPPCSSWIPPNSLLFHLVSYGSLLTHYHSILILMGPSSLTTTPPCSLSLPPAPMLLHLVSWRAPPHLRPHPPWSPTRWCTPHPRTGGTAASGGPRQGGDGDLRLIMRTRTMFVNWETDNHQWLWAYRLFYCCLLLLISPALFSISAASSKDRRPQDKTKRLHME